MFALLTILHILVCLILILVVLLQTGKRADLAGAFGGGGSQTAFGTRGAATFLSKATTISAVIFMVTSLGLAIISSRPGGGTSTVLDQVPSAPSPMAPPPSEVPPDRQESFPPQQPQQQQQQPPAGAPSSETAPAPGTGPATSEGTPPQPGGNRP